MSPQSRQEALDNISEEDLRKLKEHQASTEGAYPVDQEWLLLAEFAKVFGWEAYQDAKNDRVDRVTIQEMLTLLEANRKLEYGAMFRMAQANLIGSGSAQSKSPSSTFMKLTKDIINKTKVKE